MPNDAKTRLDRTTHRLQDQPNTADRADASPVEERVDGGADGHPAPRSDGQPADQRQPAQAQQRETPESIPSDQDMPDDEKIEPAHP